MLLAGCSKNKDETKSKPKPNVLLILVDTLRADKLGCYGSKLDATPSIDALASEGVRFENAYSHAPWTLPSTASLLTSLYPPEHGAGGRVPQFKKLRPTVRTVAQVFKDAGYATASVVNVDFLTKPFGLTRGFDHVDFEVYPSNVKMRNAERTTDAAIDWLKQSKNSPFFLMVHYFDPHLVYDPPDAYRRRFASLPDRNDHSWVFGTRPQMVRQRMGKVTFNEAQIRRAEKLYNGEVAYTDHEVGRLLDALDRMKLKSSTIVVFTADHGEEFLDHGGFAHGHTLYNELVHIPLIIRFAGRLETKTIAAPVRHVDVAPTLCRLVGIEPDPAFRGRSLVGLVDGTEHRDRAVLFYGSFWGQPLWGWLQGHFKLILTPDGQDKLFDLITDPGETHDISATSPDRAQRMKENLRLARENMMAHVNGESSAVKLTEPQKQRLRSLGYLP